ASPITRRDASMNCFRRTGSPLIPPALPHKLAPSPSAYNWNSPRVAAPSMGGRTDYPITLKLSSFARVAPQQGSLSPGALDQPIDSCEAGLPCTVMFNEAADMLEC